MNTSKCISGFVFLIFSFSVQAQIFIEGTVKGFSGKELLLYSPVNGIANNTLLQDNSSIPLDSRGRFQFTLFLNNPGFVELKIKNEPIWLFLETNDSLHVEVNLDSISSAKHTGWLNIKGNNSTGHSFYNEYNYQPIAKLIPVMELFESLGKKPVDLLQSMGDTIVKAIVPFDTLLAARKIDAVYHKLVTTSIKASLLSEALKYFFRGSSILSNYKNDALDSLKHGLFAMCNPLDTTLYKGHNTRIYLYDYYLQKELERKAKLLAADLKDSVLVGSNGNRTLVRGSYTPFLHISDSRLRENLWAMLLYGSLKMAGSYIDHQSITSFNELHPSSAWLPYINRQSEETSKRIDKQQHEAKERIYLDSVQAITSLQQLVDKLNGKPLFICLWASWSDACTQEFATKNTVDSFLNAEGITKVYISVDNIQNKEGWMQAIESYNLKGHHVLSSRSLMEDLRERVYRANEKNFPIPRYIIVNSKGEIVEKNALSPNSNRLLMDQIINVLQ